MIVELPASSLVVLLGASAAAFAGRHFRPTEVVSSDRIRSLVTDDEAAPDPAADVLALVEALVDARLRLGRLTVVDATDLEPGRRAALVGLAKRRHTPAVAIALGLPEARVGGLRSEGFRHVYVLAPDDADRAVVTRIPSPTDRRDHRGPFDIVGDVHGCRRELDALLSTLGWVEVDGHLTHPEGRTAVFVGDLVDRGPDAPGVLRRVMAMARDGVALCVPGNHDARLLKVLRGGSTSGSHGLALTLAQLAGEPDAFREEVAVFLEGLESHLVLDGGRLVVAHAGCKEEMQGRSSPAVRSFCLYGETTGELDGYGLPVRGDWAAAYRGRAKVVHGHVPVARAAWVNGVIDVDTGCVFGGRLTALRWPEEELVDVPAERVWFAPVKPLVAPERPPHRLALRDVTGPRRVETRLLGGIALPAERSAAVLELTSRFSVDPRLLLYLPPTMSPCDATPAGALDLEHPTAAFAHYAARGVDRVVVEEKHPGSRAVLLVVRDPAVATRRFAGVAPRRGVITTRTGRPLFADRDREDAVLRRVAATLDAAGRWDAWDTDWALLDAVVLVPGAARAAAYDERYGPTGAAAVHALGRAEAWLRAAALRDPSVGAWAERVARRAEAAAAFDAAWQRSAGTGPEDDPRVALLQVLATEGAVRLERDRGWHLAELGRLDGPGLAPTAHREVDLGDPTSEGAGVAWFDAVVAAGGEGVVVKPLAGLARDARGAPVQPALKVRGREPLRLVFGPEYTLPEHLERLRARSLHQRRAVALREFALGHEALWRLVEGAPLPDLHAAVSGVLALKSDLADPMA